MRKTRADRPAQPDPDAVRLHLSFLTSAPDLASCPADEVPEVAIAGRSNAGKSSVLNRLSGNRQTAKVSKTPGRTQLLNFFDVREADGGRLVDLPGYGYAKAGRAAQSRWQAAVNEYLSLRENLAGMVLVMDIRHPLQDYDSEVIQWAIASGLPLLILLNKADKLKYGAQQRVLQMVRARLRDAPLIEVITFSAATGLNLTELQAYLLGVLNGPAAT